MTVRSYLKKLALLLCIVIAAYQFSVTRFSTSGHQRVFLSDNKISHVIPASGFTVWSWNIYKEQNTGWADVLNEMATSADIIMLQELRFNPEYQAWQKNSELSSTFLTSFTHKNRDNGLLTLASPPPLTQTGYTFSEPLIRFPKGVLLTQYMLDNGATLLVINVHSINFTLGTEAYEKQLEPAMQAIREHVGPVILAGDFNTWNGARTESLFKQIQTLGMQAVTFPDDRRIRAMNRPLDHIFIRDLNVLSSEVRDTNASDHHPLGVKLATTTF